MDRDAAHIHAHPPEYYFPAPSPDAVQEEIPMHVDVTPPRRKHSLVSTTKNVVILLTAVTLALGLLGGMVKSIAVGTRRVDQLEYLIDWSRRADATLSNIDKRLARLEARRP